MSILLMLKEGGSLGIDGPGVNEDIDLLPESGANGKLTLIETKTISVDTAEFEFDNLQGDTYNTHHIIGELPVSGTDGSQYEIRIQYTVGGTRITSGNQYNHRFVQIKAGSGSRNTRASDANYHLAREQFDDAAAEKSFNFNNVIHNLGSSTLKTITEFRGSSHAGATTSRQSLGGFFFKQSGPVEKIHFYTTATNGFRAGARLSLYGYAE